MIKIGSLVLWNSSELNSFHWREKGLFTRLFTKTGIEEKRNGKKTKQRNRHLKFKNKIKKKKKKIDTKTTT